MSAGLKADTGEIEDPMELSEDQGLAESEILNEIVSLAKDPSPVLDDLVQKAIAANSPSSLVALIPSFKEHGPADFENGSFHPSYDALFQNHSESVRLAEWKEAFETVGIAVPSDFAKVAYQKAFDVHLDRLISAQKVLDVPISDGKARDFLSSVISTGIAQEVTAKDNGKRSEVYLDRLPALNPYLMTQNHNSDRAGQIAQEQYRHWMEQWRLERELPEDQRKIGSTLGLARAFERVGSMVNSPAPSEYVKELFEDARKHELDELLRCLSFGLYKIVFPNLIDTETLLFDDANSVQRKKALEHFEREDYRFSTDKVHFFYDRAQSRLENTGGLSDNRREVLDDIYQVAKVTGIMPTAQVPQLYDVAAADHRDLFLLLATKADQKPTSSQIEKSLPLPSQATRFETAQYLAGLKEAIGYKAPTRYLKTLA